MYLFKSIGGGPTYISGAAQDIQKNDRLSRGIYVPSTTLVLVFMSLSYNIKISLVVDDTVNFNLSSLKFNLSWCDY